MGYYEISLQTPSVWKLWPLLPLDYGETLSKSDYAADDLDTMRRAEVADRIEIGDFGLDEKA